MLTLKFIIFFSDSFDLFASASQMNQETLRQIQAGLGYTFKNIKLLQEALTHDSHRVNDHTVPTYQRLEFLGDSVLNLAVSDYLFRNNPNFTEGQLTMKRKELTEALKQVQIAEKLNIKDHVSFGLSIDKNKFSKYHNFVESLIGAVYIDGDFNEAKNVIYRLWELSGSPTANAGSGCVIS
jgi:ribonuclease-3